MMKAVSISEMPVSFYETIRRNIPEDSYSPLSEPEISLEIMLNWSVSLKKTSLLEAHYMLG
jgi:hypothetical protein